MEKLNKRHVLLMVTLVFLFFVNYAYAKESEIGDHIKLSRKDSNNEVKIRRMGKHLLRKPEDKVDALVKSGTPDGGGEELFMKVSRKLVDAYAKESEIGDHVKLSTKDSNNEVKIRRLGKHLLRKPEDKADALVKSGTPDGSGGELFMKESEIGDHVKLSRKDSKNEVKIRRFGKHLLRELEAEMAKSSTSDDDGGGSLSMTVSLTNAPALSPIPQKIIDPGSQPVHSKNMPTWCWILIGLAICAFVLTITWVVWYCCSHRQATQTASNQNEGIELHDLESVSSSSVDEDILRVPEPATTAIIPPDPIRPWQGILTLILLVAGAIWFYLHPLESDE